MSQTRGMEGGPRRLPTFMAYMVDFRLREFRKADHGKKTLESVPFDSPIGRKLLGAMRQEAA